MGECNEGARSQERMEEMVKLSKQLDFPPEVRSTCLCSGIKLYYFISYDK